MLPIYAFSSNILHTQILYVKINTFTYVLLLIYHNYKSYTYYNYLPTFKTKC